MNDESNPQDQKAAESEEREGLSVDKAQREARRASCGACSCPRDSAYVGSLHYRPSLLPPVSLNPPSPTTKCPPLQPLSLPPPQLAWGRNCPHVVQGNEVSHPKTQGERPDKHLWLALTLPLRSSPPWNQDPLGFTCSRKQTQGTKGQLWLLSSLLEEKLPYTWYGYNTAEPQLHAMHSRHIFSLNIRNNPMWTVSLWFPFAKKGKKKSKFQEPFKKWARGYPGMGGEARLRSSLSESKALFFSPPVNTSES